MTYEEAYAECEELIGYMNEGSLSNYTTRVEVLYREVMGTDMAESTCRDRWKDALLIAFNYLRKNGKMKEKCVAKLLNGVVINDIESGMVYSNANLTDDIARGYLDKFPMRKDLFAKLPPTAKKRKQRNNPIRL